MGRYRLRPSERFPIDANDDRPIQYGMTRWRDLFTPRQLLCHCTSVEIFRELFSEEQTAGSVNDVTKAAFVYMAFALDKLVDRNSQMTRWIPQRAVIANTFDTHDFSMKWGFAEMPLLLQGGGYEWAFYQVRKSVRELIELGQGENLDTSKQMKLQVRRGESSPPVVEVSNRSADALDQIADASVDVIVIDPPYYNNVMYAELSDFFYVWLKRTAGYIVPEFFRTALTDKEHEAVANAARFRGDKRARGLWRTETTVKRWQRSLLSAAEYSSRKAS